MLMGISTTVQKFRQHRRRPTTSRVSLLEHYCTTAIRCPTFRHSDNSIFHHPHPLLTMPQPADIPLTTSRPAENDNNSTAESHHPGHTLPDVPPLQEHSTGTRMESLKQIAAKASIRRHCNHVTLKSLQRLLNSTRGRSALKAR